MGAYWFGWARYTATPGVIGLSQQAAVAKLEHAGLESKVGAPAFSETVPKGRVVSTDPDPGAKVLHHGTVTVTMSLGKERYAVPKMARLTVDQAQDALLAQHLAYGRSVGRYSSSPKGMVLGSNPAAGRREPRGFQVDLVVSRGLAADPHPRLDRRRAPTARSTPCGPGGCRSTASDHEYSDQVAEGHVISQSPVGQVLHRGDTVSLAVSKGPPLVQVPGDLRTMRRRRGRAGAGRASASTCGSRAPTSTSASTTSSAPTPTLAPTSAGAARSSSRSSDHPRAALRERLATG